VRFYANENFPRPAVAALRAFGHDVLTTAEASQAGLSDPDVVAFATGDRRAIVTLNRKDFIKLHNQSNNHAGIIVCHVDLDFQRLAERVHAIVAPRDSAAGLLLHVPKPPKP
jgi:hypothetical protein